jgi:hypothetical protein
MGNEEEDNALQALAYQCELEQRRYEEELKHLEEMILNYTEVGYDSRSNFADEYSSFSSL